MSILSFLGSILGAFFSSLFGKSDQERLGESEERIEQYKARDQMIESMQKIEKDKTKSDVINSLRKGSFIVAFFFLLTSCASDSKPIIPACLDLKEWSQQEQEQLANELEKLPRNSMIVAAMVDYSNMRKAVRVCRDGWGNYAKR